jgi:hypothetical protein
MNVSFRAQIAFAALLACLASSVASAARPGGGPLSEDPRAAAGYSDPAAFAAQNGATASRLMAQPEPIAPSNAQDGMASDGDGGGWENYEGGCDDGCSTDSWADGRNRRGLWYGGVDYLLVRPRFSQAVAESRRSLTTDNTTSPTTSTLTDQTVQFPFKYQSSFRATLGYRLLNCGGDVSVSYWRLTGSAQVHDGPSNVTGGTAILSGVLENNTQADNQFFAAQTGVTANILDIDFAKCLSMGGPQNPCDCCFCPRWDLRWMAGARIADVSRFNNNQITDAAGTNLSFANVNARFVGAGPRVGMQGRRYFGRTGLLSVYAKANMALLIGDYRSSRTKVEPGVPGTVPTAITNQFDTFSRMIPVTDIEIGGSWQVAPYTFISAGWFFQAWWDLGQGEQIDGTNFGPLDSSNILGFDGLFVRGEMLF